MEVTLLLLVELGGIQYFILHRVYFKTDDILIYFSNLGKTHALPSFEDLETAAKTLFDAYTSPTAQYEAADDARDGQSNWANAVPLGKKWDNNQVNTSNVFSLTEMANANKQAARLASKKAKRNAKPPKKSSESLDPPFYGDRSFAEAATFKRDAMISREVAYAAAEGDVGRVWEGLKVSLFRLHSNFYIYSRVF